MTIMSQITYEAPVNWTPDLVWQWIVEAAETEGALPRDRPRGYRSMMPAPARDINDAWLQGWQDGDPLGLYRNERTRLRPMDVHAERVSRYDRVCAWLRRLPSLEAKVLWAMACGVNRIRIKRKLGVSRRTMYRTKDRALEKIVRRLNGSERCDEPSESSPAV